MQQAIAEREEVITISISPPEPKAATHTGTMSIMNLQGSEVKWHKLDPHSTDSAQHHFDVLRASGYAAYNLSPAGDEVIHRFDPNAETIVFTPPLVGG